MTEQSRKLLAKARRSLSNARRTLADGDFDFAVSRTYYAMFYAATALLLSRGLRFAKHSAVLTAINREFVRTGELDHAHFTALQLAFQERNNADYGYDDSVSADVAERVLRRAEAFLSAAEAMLSE